LTVTIIDVVATALLTYGAHSFVSCALALLCARLVRRPQDRDVIWKAALVAPIVTSAIAMTVSTSGMRSPFIDLGLVARHASPAQLPGRQVRIRVLETGDESRVDRWFSDPVTSAISGGVLIAAILAVGIASARLVVRRRRLTHAVASREDIGELALPGGTTARLSSSAELQTPVAFNGVEICLPDEVARGFSDAHQRSLIAHEVAHLERRDPAWFFATEIIAALSAFQPLVIPVVRAFRRDVELICDETAVRRTNDQHSLISALALLASPFDPRSPLHGAATAYDGSPLVGRVERIAALPLDVVPARAGRTMIVALAGALAIMCALPVVSAAPRLSDLPLHPDDAIANPHFKKIVNVNTRDMHSEVRRTVTILQ
jgi:hypothetical protein